MSDAPILTRPVGLRGRLPVKAPSARFPLRYAHEYLAAALPAPSYPIDVSGGIVDFGMMGNDAWTNCGSAAEIHQEMTTAVAAHTAGPLASSTIAIDRFKTFTGITAPPGQGLVLADFLMWLFRQGLIKAFAPVDHTKTASCDAFMAAGFGLYKGVDLTDFDEARFANRTPWTVANGEMPNPDLGHCILTVAATGPADADLEDDVTWGDRQKATRAWSRRCTVETWLVVTTEEQLALFTPALLAEVTALGGTGGAPAPVPPAPLPIPAGCLSRVAGASASSPTVAWLENAAVRTAQAFVAAFLGIIVGAATPLFSASTLHAAASAGIVAGAAVLEGLVANVATPGAASVGKAYKIRLARRSVPAPTNA